MKKPRTVIITIEAVSAHKLADIREFVKAQLELVGVNVKQVGAQVAQPPKPIVYEDKQPTTTTV